ncbi:hypothetical protein [Streptomyces sp. NPDC053367]|uniref:hypothetical protein n=1 Tax=Streptomyces sp. NPDC053367 TaxID=3365700 RepID=UPI0037D79964
MSQRTRRLRRAAVSAAAACGAATTVLSAAPAQAYENVPVYVWATDVNIRSCPHLSCAVYSGMAISWRTVDAHCQRQGDPVTDGPYANNWWVQVDAGGPRGWISAVYISTGDNWQPIPGVSTDFAVCAP